MPVRPPRTCSYPSCKAVPINGKPNCTVHHSQRLAERDARIPEAIQEYRSWYMLAPWRRLRSVVLAEQPFCASAGCNEPATDVDHIEPHRGDAEKFYDRENLQGLCKRCHGVKSAGEVISGGFSGRK